MTKIAIVYFSHSGNSRNLACYIQKRLLCDRYSIQVKQAYDTTYDVLLKEENRREVIPSSIMDRYELMIICAPTWWYHIAPAAISFLKDIDTKDKLLIPFILHGGYGTGHGYEDMKQACPQAKIPFIYEIPFHLRKMNISFQELNQMIKGIRLHIEKEGI